MKPVFGGKDYLNERFGSWIVIAVSTKTSKDGRYYWRALCDCGNETDVWGYNLIHELSKGYNKCRGLRHTGINGGNWHGYKQIPRIVFTKLVAGAISRGIKVEITIQDLQALWEKSGFICALSKLPLIMGETASVDRIDSQKSYTIENIQWVHKDVNLMKNYFDQNYFLEMCRKIVKNLEDQNAEC